MCGLLLHSTITSEQVKIYNYKKRIPNRTLQTVPRAIARHFALNPSEKLEIANRKRNGKQPRTT